MPEHLFVVTGPPGAGKTPLVGELARLGFPTVEEAARAVLAEERRAGGSGTPDRDPRRFLELTLERAVADFVRWRAGGRPVFFDRAIPDLVGYAELFDLDPGAAADASGRHRYAGTVFALPHWPEIYVTDEERKMPPEFAEAFGERVREVYVGLGYDVIDVPRGTPSSRAGFVLSTLGLGWA